MEGRGISATAGHRLFAVFAILSALCTPALAQFEPPRPPGTIGPAPGLVAPGPAPGVLPPPPSGPPMQLPGAPPLPPAALQPPSAQPPAAATPPSPMVPPGQV